MRKREAVGVVLLVALATVAVLYLYARSHSGPRLTPDNLDRLRPGMTRPEVEAVLGPATGRPSGPVRAPLSKDDRAMTWVEWMDADGWQVLVYFDATGQFVRWSEAHRPDPLMTRLRSQLGL